MYYRQASKASASSVGAVQTEAKDVQKITQSMAESTISQVTSTTQATSVAKNKYFVSMLLGTEIIKLKLHLTDIGMHYT